MADTEVGTALRVDAERNRQRIVQAAREMFAEHGLDVSMRQVALRAGVGEPTLRRRFPTKTDLVAEVFADKLTAYADAAEVALADSDPWAGFTGFLTGLARMQLVDRGFTEVLTMTFPGSMRLEPSRRRAHENFNELIGRAQQAGKLRMDFVAEDLILLLMAHAGVVAAARGSADKFSPRLVAYLLQAFAAPGAGRLPAAPTPAETYRALLRLRRDAPDSTPS